ncbi:hypothetical protein QTP86_022071 [Hemibagrus guttatus]|nr:hypothetical protein QTP86_022071 [Hemibagrus guttatus]
MALPEKFDGSADRCYGFLRQCENFFTNQESRAMEEYIEIALAAGFFRPSTSPAAAGFFYVGKKDGSLRAQCLQFSMYLGRR